MPSRGGERVRGEEEQAGVRAGEDDAVEGPKKEK